MIFCMLVLILLKKVYITLNSCHQIKKKFAELKTDSLKILIGYLPLINDHCKKMLDVAHLIISIGKFCF